MDSATSMDVEEQQPLPNSASFKRFGLRNSIQTNFGDDYVFQIVPKDDWSLMGVSLSTNVVKLYSPETGQYYGECRGHNATINQIAFSGGLDANLLHGCSSDGTIRAWDTRTFQQVSTISAGSSEEVFSFSFGGSGYNLLAGGCKSKILFWDWRNKKQVACLEESHMEDVTQVLFVPNDQNKLVSASVDGLMCIFDTAGDINEDDHMESVINVGTSIGKIGFLGERYQKLWCLTHIETISIWDWKDGRAEANFENARMLASNSWTLGQVDYFVDCHYSGDGDCLWVVGGTNAGNLGYFPVDYKGARTIGSPEAVLLGGHAGVVRSMLPMSSTKAMHTSRQGVFGWTGGEDGRLCCWSSDEYSDVNHSWISGDLVMKSPKTRRKSRHSPY